MGVLMQWESVLISRRRGTNSKLKQVAKDRFVWSMLFFFRNRLLKPTQINLGRPKPVLPGRGEAGGMRGIKTHTCVV